MPMITVQYSTPKAKPGLQQTVAAAVNQLSARIAFSANLKVFQAANRNLDTLLDIKV